MSSFGGGYSHASYPELLDECVKFGNEAVDYNWYGSCMLVYISKL